MNSSSVQSLSHVRLFATPWITARQASLSITNSWSSLKLTSIDSAISSSVVTFSSCPQPLPALESFPMSQLFAWDGQNTGVSALASFLPKNTQGWSPSEWTGWISLQFKGLSRVFSYTTLQKHHSSALSFLHSPTLTSIYDHWKNHSLDYSSAYLTTHSLDYINNRWIEKQIVACTYNGILFSHKKEWSSDTYYNIDGPQKCYTK